MSGKISEMTFCELMNVIDYNRDSGEILYLEFNGNDDFNKVRCDCLEILGPLGDYIVDSIGISDDGHQIVWLEKPFAERGCQH